MLWYTPKVIDDEESLGVDSPDGGDGIECQVRATRAGVGVRRHVRMGANPGNAIRVSIHFGGGGNSKNSARILVFVDPLTGKGIVRMGMFDLSKNRRGKEIGKQLVWETDTPVWKGK